MIDGEQVQPSLTRLSLHLDPRIRSWLSTLLKPRRLPAHLGGELDTDTQCVLVGLDKGRNGCSRVDLCLRAFLLAMLCSRSSLQC